MAEGADIVLEDPAALVRRFPWLSAEGIAGGVYGRTGEGWFDAHALLTLFRKALRQKSVDMIAQPVTGIERAANRVTAVLLGNGERLEAGTVVNAAGPNAGVVAAMAGLALPVEPRKRSVFVFEAREKYRRHAAAGRSERRLCPPGRLGLPHRRRGAGRRRRAGRPGRFRAATGRSSRR